MTGKPTYEDLEQSIRSLEEESIKGKRAEEALRTSEQRMRLALEGTDQGFWDFDLLTQKVSYGDNWPKILGYGSEDSKFDYEWYISQIHPESRPVFEKAILDYISGYSKYLEWEYQIRNKSGEWQWIQALGVFTETDKTDFPLRMIGTHRNITARKKTEEALRDSEEKYRKLAETANDLIVSIDFDGIIVYANRAAIQLAGGTNLVGMPLKDLIFIDLVDRHQEMLKERSQGYEETRSFEWMLHSPLQKDVPMLVDIKSSLLYDHGKPSGVLFIARDITDRKRIEKALQESEARFRLLAENARDCIWTMDMNLQYTYVSPYIKEGLGYMPEEYMAIPINETMTPASLERCMQALAEELEIEKREDKELLRSRTVEVEHIHKKGNIVWAEIKMTFMRNANGQATGILGYTRDITEHKRAEEALRKSEEKYRLIAENTADVISILDMNLRYTYISPSIMRLRGFTVEEAMQQNLDQALVPESLKIALTAFQEEIEMEASGTADPDRIRTLELEQYRKDGSIIWVEASLSYLRDKDHKPVGILAITRDISERKGAEQVLRKSEQRMRLALEGTDQELWDLDLVTGEGEISYSDNGYKILDYGHEANRFSFEGWLNRIHPESRPTLEKAVLDYMSGRTKSFEWEYQISNKSGEWKWVQATGVFSDTDHKGFPIRMIGTLRDITDRKRAEVDRKRLEEQLQQVQKLESIGTLAGGIAHDFNNLLMGIQGYVSLMLLDVDPSHPHYEKIKRIEEQVQSGSDLTRQLLGFARGGRYEIRSSDMNDIIEKTSTLFGRTKKEITIHRKYGKNLWSTEIDRGQMERVFMNLYVNAWQAMPGGGEIYLETDNVILDDEQAFPYTVRMGEYVKISITDTGTGMDDKTKERIFDPFFTTKGMGRGTGLGLATVYGIIKGHKGVINVDSEPGQGTTFTIYLPASQKEAVNEKTASGTIVGGTETILVVDDEKRILEVTAKLLESLGYRVYAAGSGQEAIAVFMEKGNDIDFVILDMIMPGISGGETFDRLREIHPKIKVLLSSGYSINGDAKHILDRGCNGFIQKPFQLQKLSRKIRDLMV